MSEESATYREPAGHAQPEIFSFERDARRMHARLRRVARAWRVFFAFSAFLFGSMICAGREIGSAYIPFWLLVSTVLGYSAAALLRMGNNELALISEPAVAAMAAERVWAVTTRKHGMVIFTTDRVFIERPLSIVMLHALDRLDYDADAGTLRLSWTHAWKDEDGQARSSSGNETVRLPPLAYAERSEARERLEHLRAQISERR
jgi:hypothetical protein